MPRTWMRMTRYESRSRRDAHKVQVRKLLVNRLPIDINPLPSVFPLLYLLRLHNFCPSLPFPFFVSRWHLAVGSAPADCWSRAEVHGAGSPCRVAISNVASVTKMQGVRASERDGVGGEDEMDEGVHVQGRMEWNVSVITYGDLGIQEGWMDRRGEMWCGVVWCVEGRASRYDEGWYGCEGENTSGSTRLQKRDIRKHGQSQTVGKGITSTQNARWASIRQNKTRFLPTGKVYK
ncbi:hypothetical protein PMIN01_08375 [Paraphaeosphaeria minitans]|uniref:Uncharacterized protein n=1 Tax=Paraphaeosphaeria minitans TaxID=565426 RepID=A0A9P6KPF9_9PLEO|nr:hypothetical protein PMIN01_08375 [Paraphaeosphaeria minitans]